MTWRAQTVAQGETWAALAKFVSGRTVTVAFHNAETGAVLASTGNATEIGSTGIYRANHSLLDTDPTVRTEILWIMTDSTSGEQKEGYLVVGGYVDNMNSAAYLGAVWIDVTAGAAGSTVGVNGLPTNPVNNEADARTLANALGLERYMIRGSITLTQNHLNWRFEGAASAQQATVDVGGFDVSGSLFDAITVTGSVGGSIPKNISAQDCILDTVTGWDGIAVESGIRTSLTLDAGPGSIGTFRDVDALDTLGTTVDANGANTIQWAKLTGLATVAGHTGGLLQVSGEAAILTLAASNTAGAATLAGDMLVNDSSGAGFLVVVDETINRQEIRNAMKLAPSAGAPAAGSVDQHLDELEQAVIAGSFVAGGTHSSTTVQTNATQTDDFFGGAAQGDNMLLLVVNAAGSAVRRITDYAQANGEFTVDPAFPFTPADSDPVVVLNLLAGVPINQQDVRDAMKLAPSGGAPAAGSVDEHLDDILADTNEMQGKLPTNFIMGSSDQTDQDDDIAAIVAGVASVISTGGAGPWTTADLTNVALEASVQSVISTGGTGPWTTADVSALALEASVQTAITNIGLVPAAVWNFDTSTFTKLEINLAGGVLQAQRKWIQNRREARPGTAAPPTGDETLYEDDGTTPFLTYTLRDPTDAAVVGVAGVPAERLAGT